MSNNTDTTDNTNNTNNENTNNTNNNNNENNTVINPNNGGWYTWCTKPSEEGQKLLREDEITKLFSLAELARAWQKLALAKKESPYWIKSELTWCKNQGRLRVRASIRYKRGRFTRSEAEVFAL